MQGAIEREARGRGRGHRLVMLGHLPERSTLASVLATADCFIHLNPREPYRLGPLEALAAGCGVVASRTDGTGEVLWYLDGDETFGRRLRVDERLASGAPGPAARLAA